MNQNLAFRQFSRFIATGAVNTALSYCVYALGLRMGLWYPVSNLLSTIFGICFGFWAHGRFVFDPGDKNAFLRFVSVWLVLWPANVAVIAGLVRLGFDEYSAGGVAIAPMVILSFLAKKYFVFKLRGREC